MADPAPGTDPLRELIHDLRSPLSVVDGFTNLLGRDDLDASKRADYVARLEAAVKEMRELLDAAARR